MNANILYYLRYLRTYQHCFHKFAAARTGYINYIKIYIAFFTFYRFMNRYSSVFELLERIYICATSAFRKMPMFPCWKSRLHSPTVIRFHAVVRPNLRNYWKIQIIIAYYLGTLSVQTLIYWYRNWNRKLKRKQKQKTETEAVPEAEARPAAPTGIQSVGRGAEIEWQRYPETWSDILATTGQHGTNW